MNAAGSTFAWCALQITLVGLATIGTYWLVGKLHQAAGGFTAITGLAVVFCLSAAATSPWPRWSLFEERPADDSDDSERARRGKLPLMHTVACVFSREPLGAAPRTGTRDLELAPRVAWTPVPASEEQPSFARSVFRGAEGAFWLNHKPSPGAWDWTASLAAMFAAGLAVGGTRLLLAVRAVGAARQQSRPLQDAHLVTLCQELREQLNSTRPIELRETCWLTTPVTLGWRQPVILLPSNWRQWSNEEQRAVLAHEIAHIERGDYLMWLAAQLALVLHFYHPAVHWLAARIRLEQEFAADAAAAALLGSPRVYLTTLARLALRSSCAAQKSGSAQLQAAPSFVSNQSLLLRRVERLRRMGVASDPLGAWASKLVALAILLTAGAVASGFRGESIWTSPMAASSAPSKTVATFELSDPNARTALSPSSKHRHVDH